MKRGLFATILLIASLSFGGCASTGETSDIVLSPTAAKSAVQIATILTVDSDHARAERIVALVDKVEQFVDGNPAATAGVVRDFVIANTNWNALSETERVLAGTLIDTVAAQVAHEIGAKLLSPDQVVKLREVLSWVKETAQGEEARLAANTG